MKENTDIIYSEDNVGFSGGNNIGIRYAKERYAPELYLLINNDTIVQPDTIEQLVKTYMTNNNVGIVTGKICYYEQPNLLWAARGKFSFITGLADQPDYGKEDDKQYDDECNISFASGCLMLIPQKIIQYVGLLDEKFFLYAEDTDYCCRVLKSGYNIVYTGKATIYHKVSQSVGKKSSMQQYYMFRNNCYIVSMYCKYPFYGYLRRFYRAFKDIISGELELTYLIQAWKDFKKGITGKRKGM